MARRATASDQLVERLIEWGVDTVFGLPGDGINGVMEALRAHSDRIRFVHMRHEESAALAACAYGKFTGRIRHGAGREALHLAQAVQMALHQGPLAGGPTASGGPNAAHSTYLAPR